MKSNNAATRPDVVINSVDHQISSLANSAASTGQLETLLTSGLDHNLIAGLQQYLEMYLDSDATGRVPLDAEQFTIFSKQPLIETQPWPASTLKN